ncbi:hypothetical protein ACIQMP_07635 [Streptomyces sp. NPDC091385]|uniref:hypothetical protein n=1 Tax=Streptomyces sp. NPDC091385 TaxID=3365997 RepID=UPI00381B5004
MELTYAWAPITKAEEQDDGTFMVYGPAASSHLDRDRQRLNEKWLDTAMPAWFNQGANVREQHDAKRAVGVGVGLVKGDGDSGHMLASHIVDPVACLKVKHKVLKGYSVGIKNPKVTVGKADAPGGEVVGGDIVEVSIVDRPCNPTTLFEIAKADGASGDLAPVDDATVVEKSDAAAFGIAEDVYGRLPEGVRAALTALASAGATVSTDTIKADETSTDGLPIMSPSFLLKVAGGTVTSEMVQGLVDERVAERLAELGKTDKPADAAAGDSHATTSKEGTVPTEKTAADATAEKTDGTDAAAQAAVVEKAEGILRDVRALVPTLTKADGDEGEDGGDEEGEGGEISGADEAVACIARLIVAEAEALAGGDLRKAVSIGLLLDAVRSLKWFKREQDCADEMALADTTKADTTTTKADTTTAEAAATTETKTAAENKEPLAALTKADVAELVKSAVAEVQQAHEERLTALTGELTKATKTIEELKALPVPGGPALTRTAAQAQAARGSDADRLRAEAADLATKADQCSDRELRDGYLERRRELLAKADA